MSPYGRRCAAIFDLDGVLVETSVLHTIAWERLAAAEGFPIDARVLPQLRGRSREASLQLLLGDRAVDPATFQRMLEAKNAWYRASLLDLSPHDAMIGARACLADLARAGWLLAVGSSSKNAIEVLRRLELDVLFDAIVDGNTVEAAKPNAAVFVEAARRLGMPPESCVVIEDAAAGIEAARRAEMASIGVGDPAHLGDADMVVESVADISVALLERLLVARGRR